MRSDYYKMLIGGDPSKSNPRELEDLIEVSLLFVFSVLYACHKLSVPLQQSLVCAWMDTADDCE
jgi:hypothetical protein